MRNVSSVVRLERVPMPSCNRWSGLYTSSSMNRGDFPSLKYCRYVVVYGNGSSKRAIVMDDRKKSAEPSSITGGITYFDERSFSFNLSSYSVKYAIDFETDVTSMFETFLDVECQLFRAIVDCQGCLHLEILLLRLRISI